MFVLRVNIIHRWQKNSNPKFSLQISSGCNSTEQSCYANSNLFKIGSRSLLFHDERWHYKATCLFSCVCVLQQNAQKVISQQVEQKDPNGTLLHGWAVRGRDLKSHWQHLPQTTQHAEVVCCVPHRQKFSQRESGVFHMRDLSSLIHSDWQQYLSTTALDGVYISPQWIVDCSCRYFQAAVPLVTNTIVVVKLMDTRFYLYVSFCTNICRNQAVVCDAMLLPEASSRRWCLVKNKSARRDKDYSRKFFFFHTLLIHCTPYSDS